MLVGENIGAGDVRAFDDEGRWRSAAAQGLAAEFVEALPSGYQTQLGKWFKDGRELSGGQWQKIALARAFMRSDADILVLDEPTAAIDVEGRRDFWNIMRSVAASGKTVIFATHYLEEADSYADRIVLMARGRIVADGPPTEIKAKVGGRVIRATLEGVAASDLMTIEGVTTADRQGDGITISCADAEASDKVLRELLTRYPRARDLEVRGVGLEEAFLLLTADDGNDEASQHHDGQEHQ
jgi:ABC-2 type transport system ATP-binding protein